MINILLGSPGMDFNSIRKELKLNRIMFTASEKTWDKANPLLIFPTMAREPSVQTAQLDFYHSTPRIVAKAMAYPGPVWIADLEEPQFVRKLVKPDFPYSTILYVRRNAKFSYSWLEDHKDRWYYDGYPQLEETPENPDDIFNQFFNI